MAIGEHKDSMEQTPLLVLLGPTASGKTRLAVQVALRLGGEIVSVDSRQVYRGMDIGTGKDLAEYTGVPYHLIDIVAAGHQYNVREFVEDFRKVYPSIVAKGRVPLLCGGTGMYLQALLAGHRHLEIPIDPSLRERLHTMDRDALLLLWERLPGHLFPSADISTTKRLMRAIEIVTFLSANPDIDPETIENRAYPAVVFGLNPDRDLRRHRITIRLKDRLANGLIEEVASLLNKGLSAEELIYYGLEYKWITMYLVGDLKYDEMVAKLETEIHRFAKRQMTFFRKMEKDGVAINWLNPNEPIDQQTNYIVDTYRRYKI
ncbi:tRNA dimethylallyltransferase [Dyadobacter jejuensis]|uniref:tRNA dimethylallyltransferase n=1 Tax=Dyadobacter jejuensis TaxID=1082580 RepID=A0A316AQ28_9BACT|nr:tRNA (adenosine(37)-N6)-dimethylallyltransferase MiaA [Dyadobacter jejuensis]PWJ58930.1 tRNA dimethylallyltransferase [Dyadobacter jejuensis]